MSTTRADQLAAYLSLGADVCHAIEDLAARVTAKRIAEGFEEDFVDRVLIALALKIDGAFRALLDDARVKRSEAMHHLKTMAEAFIYLCAVNADNSSTTAELVLGDAYRRKVETLTNSRQVTPQEIAFAREMEAELHQGRKPSFKDVSVKSLAEKHGVESWYWEVYRLACEPAHLGDLMEFMPEGLTIETGARRTPAIYRATVSVHHGVTVALAVLDSINWKGLSVPTGEYKRRLTELSELVPQR